MAEVFGDTDKSAAVEVESNTMETDREVRTMTIFSNNTTLAAFSSLQTASAIFLY